MKKQLVLLCLLLLMGFHLSALRMFRVFPNDRTEPGDGRIVRAPDVGSYVDYNDGDNTFFPYFVRGPVKHLKIIQKKNISEFFYDEEGYLVKEINNGTESLFFYDKRMLYSEIHVDGEINIYHFNEECLILSHFTESAQYCYYFDENLKLLKSVNIVSRGLDKITSLHYDEDSHLIETRQIYGDKTYTMRFYREGDTIQKYDHGDDTGSIYDYEPQNVLRDQHGNWLSDGEYVRTIEYYGEGK